MPRVNVPLPQSGTELKQVHLFLTGQLSAREGPCLLRPWAVMGFTADACAPGMCLRQQTCAH